MEEKIKIKPKEIFEEYKLGTSFKEGLGEKGIYEQTKINERFYIGDQWHGLSMQKPLVRNNVIKRIGEYKAAVISAAPISVCYSAEGIDNIFSDERQEEKQNTKDEIISGHIPNSKPDDMEISVITEVLSNYFKITAERVKFDNKKEQLLRNAYISGTGIAYTYWNPDIKTGLYADEEKSTAIEGDIDFEILDIENVCFGDPNNSDIQSQPFIIISQRLNVEAVRREAKREGLSEENINNIVPDNCETYNSGDRGENEPQDSKRVTVITKFYKEYKDDNKTFTVKAVKTTEKAYVRKPWDLKSGYYPFSMFNWERRRSSIYGESEITYLIPNQIAINRALTAAVWDIMSTGMPIMVVNGDVVTQQITNEPGQIVKVYGDYESVNNAIRYIQPPSLANGMQNFVNGLIETTLQSNGANDAALGNLRPDNAAAIIQMREASLQPLQIYTNRFYDFIEDTARIWADMWLNCYGSRKIRVDNEQGTQYIPFNAERYKNLCLTARIDVGSATLYSDAVIISTLDGLLNAGLITPIEYLERLPKGAIPKITELINNKKKQIQQATMEQKPIETSEEDGQAVLQNFAQQYPKEYAEFQGMSPEEQQVIINSLSGGQGQVSVNDIGDM